MNISSLSKKSALSFALAIAATSSAYASQHDIQVWANVDPTLDLRKADGTPLWDTVQMTHKPATGLDPWTQQVRLYTNSSDKDVGVRLAAAPAMVNGNVNVPLSVSLNNTALSTTVTTFQKADLYPGGLTSGTSISMPFSIRQSTVAPLTVAGRYEGTVSIVMVQQDSPAP